MVGLASELSKLSPQVQTLVRRLEGRDSSLVAAVETWDRQAADAPVHGGVCTARQAYRPITSETRQRIADGYQAGRTIRELADEFGVHRTSVMRIMRENGVATRTHVLGDDVLERVTGMRRDGMSLDAIARELGVQRRTVRQFLVRHGIETVGSRVQRLAVPRYVEST